MNNSEDIQGLWHLEGYDTFTNELYRIPGVFESFDDAVKAAWDKLQEIEHTQPTEDSGGQSLGAIQDRVFVVCPDGPRVRIYQHTCSLTQQP